MFGKHYINRVEEDDAERLAIGQVHEDAWAAERTERKVITLGSIK